MKPQRQAELCRVSKAGAQIQQMHTASSRSVLRSAPRRKPLRGEWERQDWCSTGGGFLTRGQNWALGQRTHRKEHGEKQQPICHHSLQNHCLSGTISSSPCHSSRKVSSHRALSKWERGSILTSALGLGSPTVPASHTPPAH